MKRRCVVLDIYGKRCGAMASRTVKYHGENEFYTFKEPSVTWVIVPMCKPHADEADPPRPPR